MAYHPYQMQGNGAYLDPNMFQMPVAGMPSPFIPVTGHVGMPSYPGNVGHFGNMPYPSNNNVQQQRMYDRLNRQPIPKPRRARGKGGKPHAEHGLRLAVFIEYPKGPYHFVEDDLMELFSYFGGVASVIIKPNIAAAELCLMSNTGAREAILELDNLEIQGVGTIRCIEINRGETLDYALSRYHAYDKQGNNISHPGRRTHEDSKVPRGPAPEKPFLRRLARFELIDVFTYEPEFNVASQIIGHENANIEYIMRNAEGKVDITITGKPLNSAPVAERLHVSLSSEDPVAYKNAMSMLEELLTTVCENFVEFSHVRGKIVPQTVGFCRHEYRGADGNLKYMGVTEPPKTWLSQVPSIPPYKQKQLISRPPQRKVSDRSRGIHRNVLHLKTNNRLTK